ncbi:UNVERIFIED_CONTAM: hypothetical protein Sangu_3171000 [Sesamum angustifolium]|uniref:Reverse transcriptase domain-containing protein n=1 Tax=Sesamum angustifolium TaxID=2727405 RepID=A0AAW2JVF3_9LAMI
MFRFDNYLALSPGFIDFVQDIWRHHIVGTPIYSVTRKLKALKPIFRQQRKKKGDLSANVKLAGEFLEISQQLLQEDRHDPWGDQCTRAFFRKVAIRRANKRIFQISDEAGNTFMEPNDISNVFVAYYQLLLGGDRTDRAMDLRYLRPWARHIVTDEEASLLIRPITQDDVKTAVFDIEEDRAPDQMATHRDSLKQHGRARGLRQNPVSPYLFVLVMEVLHLILRQFIEQDGGFAYHWQCKDLGLFQLSFADDLILLCKAEVRSVDLFRRGLDLFASLSGLHTNPQKSHLILSKAANGVRTALLETLGFQEGRLPLRYLGLPLIASRLTMLDCQPLLQKIDARIHGWDGVGLSFVGQVQLIKSVLLAFEVYWAMTFLLPKGVIKEIVKRIRPFLWKGNSSSGYPKVAWESVCKPIEEGGQGIRDILTLNRALMSCHLWSVIKHEKESIWVDWTAHYRLRDASIWTVNAKRGAWS